MWKHSPFLQNMNRFAIKGMSLREHALGKTGTLFRLRSLSAGARCLVEASLIAHLTVYSFWQRAAQAAHGSGADAALSLENSAILCYNGSG